jgi:hypothetical protein
MNNPLKFIDVNGDSVEVKDDSGPLDRLIRWLTGTKSRADQAVEEANSGLGGIVITRDKKTGKLSVGGLPIGDREKMLYDAITDKNITVSLTVTDKPFVTTADGIWKYVCVGVFDGSQQLPDGKIIATQYVNLGQARSYERLLGYSAGRSIIHEINEAFIGAKINPGAYSNAKYNEAHSQAKALDPVDPFPHIIAIMKNTKTGRTTIGVIDTRTNTNVGDIDSFWSR